MSAGMLRHRVTLLELVETTNAYGEPVKSYADWQTVWGLVEDARGSERYLAKQAQSEVDVRVLIRYRGGVSPTMRVRHGARTLQIDFVRRPDDRRRYLELHCRELPSDGT